MCLKRIGLVLICGPPGTGKTTLVNTFLKAPPANTHLVPLVYDTILPPQLEAMLVSSNEWRTGRHMILKLTSVLIDLLQDHSALNDPIGFFQTRLDRGLFDSQMFSQLFQNFFRCLNLKVDLPPHG